MVYDNYLIRIYFIIFFVFLTLLLFFWGLSSSTFLFAVGDVSTGGFPPPTSVVWLVVWTAEGKSVFVLVVDSGAVSKVFYEN